MIKEIPRTAPNGFAALLAILFGILGSIVGIVAAGDGGNSWLVLLFIFLVIVLFVCLWGFFMVNPNEGRVLQFFGSYVGTVKDPGLRWANPFYSKKPISLRVMNFETENLKVNDLDGNPVEIGAVVVWKVEDTAEALFEVDDFAHYLRVQS